MTEDKASPLASVLVIVGISSLWWICLGIIVQACMR